MAASPLKMVAPAEAYRARRAKLAQGLHRPMVILAGRAVHRNYEGNVHPFRAGSTYLYFGGPSIEGAGWIIEPGSDGHEGCTLLREVAGFEDVVWTGDCAGDDEIAAAAGIDVGRLVEPGDAANVLDGRGAGVISPPCLQTRAWADALGLTPASEDEIASVVAMRLIKDEHELAAMRRAAAVSVEAHRAAIATTKPGVGESEIAAAYGAVVASRGCGFAFTPGITVRGDVLHSEGYPRTVRDGQLLLVDAGAEEPGGYACDVTRTFPVSGRFTSIQRQLYETALRAEREAVAACVPGRRYRDIHDLAAEVICAGLIEADLLRGDAGELAARGAHTLFFVHGLGHLIGLDVHDMEDFGDLAGYAPGRTRRAQFGNKYLRLDRDLVAGMTLTVEPGIYFIPAIWENESLVGAFSDCVNRSGVDELLAAEFGGIRIEDTVCVTEAAGPEVLSSALPSDADAVAAIVGSRYGTNDSSSYL
jgi:Xaa-Pro aminopeptidase